MLAGDGAQIDTTTAAGRLVSGIFAALAEFERELDPGNAPWPSSSRGTFGRKGRPEKFALTNAQVRLAQGGRCR